MKTVHLKFVKDIYTEYPLSWILGNVDRFTWFQFDTSNQVIQCSQEWIGTKRLQKATILVTNPIIGHITQPTYPEPAVRQLYDIDALCSETWRRSAHGPNSVWSHWISHLFVRDNIHPILHLVMGEPV